MALSEIIASIDLLVLNKGKQHIFGSNGRGFAIDVTFANDAPATFANRKLRYMYTHNDHQATICEILHDGTSNKPNNLDEELFKCRLANVPTDSPANNMTSRIIARIEQTCDGIMQKGCTTDADTQVAIPCISWRIRRKGKKAINVSKKRSFDKLLNVIGKTNRPAVPTATSVPTRT
uniref:Uncharacterized protein n=1 Tax=Glossina brevipalpis TaxID=37001 RepID=A0A1A9WDI9_9MUSC